MIRKNTKLQNNVVEQQQEHTKIKTSIQIQTRTHYRPTPTPYSTQKSTTQAEHC
jgi:hypothetical protein